MEENRCIAITKTTQSVCNRRVSEKSQTHEYCHIHLKIEQQLLQNGQVEDYHKRVIISGEGTNNQTYIFIATHAPVAVILKRHPSPRWYQLIRWDLNTNELTFGQCLKKVTKIYEDRCCISPCGNYFSYFYTFQPRCESYTVISEVPYFTARALWEHGGTTWVGGGKFQKNGFSLQNPDKGTIPQFRSPIGLRYPIQNIYADQGKIYVNGNIMFDLTEGEFQNVVAPYSL